MKRKRSNFIVTIITLLMATMLMACSSKVEPAEETKETEVAAIKEETIEADEVKEAESIPEPTDELTAEPTPEPTDEPIVYEGIDMESTLPGKEWVESFKNIITEPKIVIVNDVTNKKVIVEDGQEATIEEGDILVAYTPNLETYVKDVSELPTIKRVSEDNYYTEIVIDKEYFVTKNKCKVTFASEHGDIVVNCKLIPAY